MPPGDWSYTGSPDVGIGFSIPKFGDDDRRERFRIIITPAAFAAVAQEMMKVDPEEAIKAFGKAMQDVKIPRITDERAA
jgi:hypothetical protein